MNLKVSDKNEIDNILKFTLHGVNVSIANAIRRIILSEIPSVVFRTFPHAENKMEIIKNTTRFTNEILKQRLSCVPVYMTTDVPYDNFYIEVKKQIILMNICMSQQKILIFMIRKLKTTC